MERLALETKNITDENIKKILELFPNVATEALNENGNLKTAIDFEKLKQELSEVAIDGEECYDFTWVGKKEAIIEANRPIRKTLRPDRESSVDWENTQNVYIEGDNLDALKLLQESYLSKIKMIYIDPPYNTGNDFIYNDSFSMDKNEYEEGIEYKDEEGNIKFKKNEVSNPRYHSAWCSMIYSRLKLARNLLSDDGVIFISIDDNEISNSKKICDEIFGEDNFIDILMIEMSNTGGMKVGAAKTGTITKNGEYIILYAKSQNYKQTDRTPLYDYVPGFDTHFNLFLSSDNNILKLDYILAEDKNIVEEFKHFGIEKTKISLKKYADYFEKSEVLQQFAFNNADKIVRPRTEVPFIPENVSIFENKWIKFNSDKRSESYYLTKNENGTIIQLVPMSYNYRNTDDFKSRYGRSVIRGDYWKGFWLDMGNIAKEGDIEYKNGKKPVRLIRQLAKWAILRNKNAIMLDFFSGSATTAHACMQLNAEDGGNRKFIMVQLPEKTDEKSEAFKAGYKNICEIGEERIRRAGKKIQEKI